MIFQEGPRRKRSGPFYLKAITAMTISVRSLVFLPLFLAACGSATSDDAGISPGEASALNEAATELDAQSALQRQGKGLNPAAMSAARADRQRTDP